MSVTRPPRVLIADDNYSMRKVIRAFLEEEPTVEVCAVTASGTEAVDAALALRPALIILDAVMPGLNGVEAASVLKKSLPQSKIILFTMYGDLLGRTLVGLAGVDVVLAKSQGLSALAKTISTAVDEITEQ